MSDCKVSMLQRRIHRLCRLGGTMKLIFQNSRGEERVIAEPQDKKEAVKEINKFLDDHNYKSYYMNVCEDDNGRLRIDVGSWSEFFYLENMSLEEWAK